MKGNFSILSIKLALALLPALVFLPASANAQVKVDARLHTYSGSCSNCDLSNKTMTRMKLENSDLSGSLFNRSNLSGANFDNSNLSATSFRRAYLVGVSGKDVNLEKSVMPDSTLIEAKLTDSNLRFDNLIRADLSRGEFNGSIFNDSNLISVSAEGANFSGSHFANARADHINLTDANLNKTLLHDVKFGNAIFEGTTLKEADLSGADLRNVTGLTQAQLDTACGNYKTRLPVGMSLAYCKQELDTIAAHGNKHRREGHPPHINRAAEDLDDALKSIETLLSSSDDRKTRRELQAIHADVMAARDALER